MNMGRLSSAVLLLLFAFACDSSGEDAGITGRFSGVIPYTAEQSAMQPVLTLLLVETGGVVSGNGTQVNPGGMFTFAVSGTVAGGDFFLQWVPIAGNIIEENYEGRVNSSGLSGVFRRTAGGMMLTVENTVLERE